jgi:hypothetical protein
MGGGGVRVVQAPAAQATGAATAVAEIVGEAAAATTPVPSPWGRNPPTATPTLAPVYERSADQQIVGTWQASDGTNAMLATFNSDGTVIVMESSTADQGPSLGSWVTAGTATEREVIATWIRFRVDADGRAAGTIRTRSRIRLNAALDAFVAEARVDAFDLSGATVNPLRASYQGKRVAAERPD